MHAHVVQLRQRRDAAREFRIRARAAHGPQPAVAEDGLVLVEQVDAVVSAAAVVEQSETVEVRRRRRAVALDAARHLARTLAVVREHGRFVLVRDGRDLTQQALAARVLGVEAEDTADEPALVVVLVHLPQAVGRVVEVVDAAAQHGAEAHVAARGGVGLRKHVHVEIRGDARRKVLEDGELREVVHVVRRQLCLHREHLLVQPVEQRQVVRIAAQKRHRRVCVRVLEAGHHEIAREVDLAVKRARVLARRADVLDAVVLDPQLRALGLRGRAVSTRPL